VSSTVLTLVVIPAIYATIKGARLSRASGSAPLASRVLLDGSAPRYET